MVTKFPPFEPGVNVLVGICPDESDSRVLDTEKKRAIAWVKCATVITGHVVKSRDHPASTVVPSRRTIRQSGPIKPHKTS